VELDARPSESIEGRAWETTVFRTATSIALLHALDDAFLNRQAGIGLGQHALAAVISLAAGSRRSSGSPDCVRGSGQGSRWRLASSRSSTARST
jgi:hypothetical protein